MPIVVGIGLLVLLSMLTTTPESRAEARHRLARWNPLFIAIIVAGLAFILWPR